MDLKKRNAVPVLMNSVHHRITEGNSNMDKKYLCKNTIDDKNLIIRKIIIVKNDNINNICNILAVFSKNNLRIIVLEFGLCLTCKIHWCKAFSK